ncbi:SDR family NAD(P)-dependent oxidoreductase [Salisediminibacterium halotolerans]|uniref:NAD(P)-dependent dehydrogenase, short-chain alcohol dehydrogenase family n=1 Tax=Salisediminibacterium halotolerans TaxID=517425 RepID=A0A1H9R6M9_9BACI|nr:SDR family NAD(P)-dependent oxidoreductase [Salisediminibacterium haloalkalitolerans]SER68358.1 NAD(P)-dependent dehydrogenase, short-chain alcohol dehydrogenase family [Salisediminibacterium haloalkalitolerans]
MSGRTVVITGANSGIGLAASVMFAAIGDTVVMACRNPERGKTASEAVIEATGFSDVRMRLLDMASFQSIRDFGEAMREEFSHVDILINNAAYIEHGAPHRLSPDGIELTYATNVFGPFLLTEELRGLLKQSADPRILNVASNIIKHFFDEKKSLDFNVLRGEWPVEKRFRVYDQYRDSKMALVMMTFASADSLAADGIAVNALQVNGAQMSRATVKKFTRPWRIVANIQNAMLPPVQEMAANYVVLTTEEEYRGKTGRLYNHDRAEMISAPDNPNAWERVKQVSGAAYYPAYAENKAVQSRLIGLCEEFTGALQPPS